MLRYGLITGLAIAIAGCGPVRNTVSAIGVGQSSATRTNVESNGVKFKARSTADKQDRRAFTATSTPFAIDPERSLEAARYQATRYCILTFGGSDTEWTIGPETPIDALPISNDTVTLQGRCTQK